MKWPWGKKVEPSVTSITFDEARDLLSRITYERFPTSMELDEEKRCIEGAIGNQVSTLTKESDTATMWTQDFPDHGWATPEDFVAWVYRSIQGAEVHECMEWFRVNGHAPYYPHEADPLPWWRDVNAPAEEPEDGRTDEDPAAVRGSDAVASGVASDSFVFKDCFLEYTKIGGLKT